MKTILVASQKGGTGKSTIADELAFGLGRMGLPTSFYDLDGQGAAIHGTEERPDALAAVVDTPGALQADLPRWIAAADVVIIPTRPSSRDIGPLRRMLRAFHANRAEGARLLLVVNGVRARCRAAQDFWEWLATEAEGARMLALPLSEAFIQAAAAGKSVVEYAPKGKAAQAVAALVAEAKALAEL